MILTGANTLMGISTGQYDGHTHVFSADLPMVEGRRYTPRYDATPAMLSEVLATHNLQGAILVQPSFLGSDNTYLLNTLRHQPQQNELIFNAVVVLNPSLTVDHDYLQSLTDLGVIGIRLNLVGCAAQFNYADWQDTLSAVEKFGWHIELHCEAEYLPLILPGLVQRHSRVVIDHFGLISDPDHNAGFRTIMEQPIDKIWVKASAPYRIYPAADRNHDASTIQPLLVRYLDHLGPDHLLWGSDWPFTQFEGTVDYQHTMSLLL